jgi:hypothetical protein
MKIDILLTTLNRNNINHLTLTQATLPVRHGGLGLADSYLTAHSAYVAASIISHDEISYHFPLFTVYNTPYYHQFQISADFIASHVPVSLRNNYTIDHLLTLHPSTSFKLQSTFSGDMFKSTLADFQNELTQIPGHIHLAWFTSLQNTSAGAFLLATPKTEAFTFTNSLFTTALSIRLHLNPPILSNGQRCNCRKQTIIDSTCHHLITGCNEGGLRQRIHNDIEHTLQKLFQYCGLTVKLEEIGCFQGMDIDDHKRPDLSILNSHLIGFEQKVIIDISLTSPLEGAANGSLQPLSIADATKSFRKANLRNTDKHKKYDAISRTNNLHFIAFVLETTGAIHPDGENFLKKIAQLGSEFNHIPYNIFYNYITKTISCALHRSIANNINHRVGQLLLPRGSIGIPYFTDIIGIDINDNSDCFPNSGL